MEKKCNHKGKWRKIGIIALKEGLDNYVIAIYCEACGKIKVITN